MKKGFTLLELVIVVIIIAVLAGLGIPQFLKTVERARAAEGVTALGAMRTAQLRYYAEYSVYTSTCTNLDVAAPAAPKWFSGTATCSSVPGSLVALTRTSGYTLTIADTGTVSCTSATVGGNAVCPSGF